MTGGKGEPFWYELDVFWAVWRLGTGVLPASLEAVAVAVHLQDVDVVGEPVQQRPGKPFGAEQVSPLVEGEVGGDQDGASFVALAEDLEEEFRAGGGQGHEAQLVDDQQPEAGQLPLQVEQAAVVPGLHEFADQGRGGGEAHRHPPLAGSQAQAQAQTQTQTQGDVGLAGATCQGRRQNIPRWYHCSG